MKFENLELSPEIQSGLKDIDLTELTTLQEQVIPIVLKGENALIKEAESGNFASFTVPALQKISQKESADGISALVITPNPEEAHQIEEQVRAVGYHAQISCASVDMDADAEEQEEAVTGNTNVLVGNPGPLQDILKNLRYVFRNVDLVVIDAVDEMVELKLQSKIKSILRRVTNDFQILFYMDEYNDDVKELVEYYVDKPAILGFDKSGSAGMFSDPPTVDSSINHGYMYVPSRMGMTTLETHIKENNIDNGVIFSASKRGTDRLYRKLKEKGISATSLHGKLSDEKRTQRFANFTNGDVQFLLVADISAATLDLNDVSEIINYDVPGDPDEYRYRTGLLSSNKKSRLVSLVSKQDRSDINKLEKELKNAPKEWSLPKSAQKQKKKRNSKKRQNGHRKKKKKEDKGMELPQPDYNQLSGGKNGEQQKDKKSTVIGMLKSLFS